MSELLEPYFATLHFQDGSAHPLKFDARRMEALEGWILCGYYGQALIDRLVGTRWPVPPTHLTVITSLPGKHRSERVFYYVKGCRVRPSEEALNLAAA